MSLVPRINQAVLDKSRARARERGIELPTFAQMKDPKLIPDRIAKRLKGVGLWDVDPANLFPVSVAFTRILNQPHSRVIIHFHPAV